MGLYITIFNNNNNNNIVLKVILKAIKPWYYSDLEKESKIISHPTVLTHSWCVLDFIFCLPFH